MKIYSLMNQKGGVGKSTISVNLAHGLAKDGFKVLLMDCDSQRNSTLASLGYFPDPETQPYSSYDILYNSKEELRKKGISIIDAVIHTELIDVIPASNELATIEPSIVGQIGKEYRIKQAMANLNDQYDFVIIDSPPNVGTISVNILTACDGVIIPSMAQMFSLSALGEINQQISTVNEYLRGGNPVRACGILLNMYSPSLLNDRDMKKLTDDAANVFKIPVFKSRIRMSTTITKAQGEMVSLWDYTARHKHEGSYVMNSVNDYYDFIREWLSNEKIPMKGKLRKFMKANFD